MAASWSKYIQSRSFGRFDWAIKFCIGRLGGNLPATIPPAQRNKMLTYVSERNMVVSLVMVVFTVMVVITVMVFLWQN